MNKKNVLVINAPNVPFTDSSLLIEPIDVLTVASYIQTLGCTVFVRDLDHEKRTPQFIDCLLDHYQPDYVIVPFDYHIPLYTAEAIKGVEEIALSAARYGARVVIGGRPAKIYPEKFISHPHIVVAVGEMEPILENLLQLKSWNPKAFAPVSGLFFLDGNKIIRNPNSNNLFDLNKLPIPNRSLLNINEYIDVRTILSSRGCVEKCHFCPVHTFWGRWRAREPKLVVDEIEYLVETYIAHKILFLDDHAMVNKKRIHSICKDIITRKIKVTLGCLGTPGSADPETLDLMAAAGFRWIHYGAESGSDKVLKIINKRSSRELIKIAIQITRERGIRVRTSWILDAPGTDSLDLEQTLELILESNSEEIRVHHLVLRAGAPLANQIGIEASKTTIPSQYIHSDTPQVSLTALSREHLLERTEWLSKELSQRGYLSIKNPIDWAIMNDPAFSKPDVRFVSFCPGRYGVGWQV